MHAVAGRARRPCAAARRTRPAPARAERPPGVVDLAVPGIARRRARRAARASNSLERRRGERDVTDVRRVERAAEEPDHVRDSSVSSPTSTSCAAARAGGAQRRLELRSSARRRAGHAVAAVGAQDAVRAAAVGCGPVDEEVGELVALLRGAAPAASGGQSSNSARRKLVDARAGRAREREHRAARAGRRARTRAAPAAGRSCSARRSAGARRARRRTRASSRVDRREVLVRVVRGRVDDVHEQARALEVREELVAEADALARALDQARARRRP